MTERIAIALLRFLVAWLRKKHAARAEAKSRVTAIEGQTLHFERVADLRVETWRSPWE